MLYAHHFTTLTPSRSISLSIMLGGPIVLAMFAANAAAEVERVTFNRDVRPILARACFQCHGPDEKSRQAELRFDTPMAREATRDGKPILTAGEPGSSLLFQRITAGDADQRMPPSDSGKTLSANDIQVIRRWIEQGAEWQRHWSFISPVRPQLPAVKRSDWPRNAIDRFVLARQKSAGLSPSPPADKRTLIRRVTIDLTGLPPTLEEIEAFLADENPFAYERVVDRLLASPPFGERMTLDWLDAARYADTHGYHEDYHREMWPWRDWVIDAFNSGMPFDQFTVEQLAGDLLPGATDRQKIATGFNRNHGITASGISEEYRVEYVLDRLRTTSAVWLGLTVGCAQCHDHKYDPITQQDFYRLFAYFNTVKERGVENRSGNVDPLMTVRQPELDAELAALKEQIESLQRKQMVRAAEIGPALLAWEQEQTKRGIDAAPEPPGLALHLPFDEKKGNLAGNRANEELLGTVQGTAVWEAGRFAGALSFDGRTHVDLGQTCGFERTDAFSYGAWVYSTGSGAILSRMDDASSYRGFDVYWAGDNRLEVHIIHDWPENAIHFKAKESLPQNVWRHVFVTYDGSSKAGGTALYVNGEPQAVDVTRDGLTQSIRTEKPLHVGRRNPSGLFTGLIDDVRIYHRALSAAEVELIAGIDPIGPILAIAAAKRTREQRETLRDYYLKNHDNEYKRRVAQLANLTQAAADVEKRASSVTVMVMREMEQPRDTFVLTRGRYDQRGEKVKPGTPAFLQPLPKDAPANRLGLARWLTSKDHPLTARVAVNRLWQLAFGTGIVSSADDFGTQGEWPSHPDLLDWLAVEFIDGGWDVKRMMRLIVTSQTYRQSSRVTADLLARDPENRWLARGPRYRLPAEMVRDNALAAAGLLVERIGGPSVKPYQPEGLWLETSNRGYSPDAGASLFRRSMYTYWKRSVPPPNMAALDAPNRETCVTRRQRTNTPLMALVLMNDPTFVEAARALAERMLTKGGAEPEQRIAFAFEAATARPPTAEESRLLLEVYRRQQQVFDADRAAGQQLLAVGSSARNLALDTAEHAAWTAVAMLILNLDETISKE